MRSIVPLLAVVLLVACGGSRYPSRAFDSKELMVTVRILSSPQLEGRKFGTAGGKRARAFLVDALKGTGLSPVPGRGYRQPVQSGANVMAVAPGAGELAAEIVLVGAHMDGLGIKNGEVYPGANDNASGVAALLAVARAWVADPPDDRRTVYFVAFDGEEAGLIGSKYFAEHLPFPRRSLAAVVVLDMVGGIAHPAFGPRLSVLGTEKSPELSAIANALPPPDGVAVAAVGLHLIENLPFRRQVWSDYGPFRDLEIPFAFVSSGLNPDYHQPSDTGDSVSPRLLAAAAGWLYGFLNAAATLEARPTFRADREERHRDLREIAALLERAMAPSSGFEGGVIRRDKLHTHRTALRRLVGQVARGEPLTTGDLHEVRTAALRLACYAGGPDSPFAPLCNAF